MLPASLPDAPVTPSLSHRSSASLAQGTSPIDGVVGEGVCLETVRTLRCADAFYLPFILATMPRWASLSALHISSAGLTALPDLLLTDLPLLAVLVLDNNKLTTLPSVAPRAAGLRILSADKNQLTALPQGLVACTQLEVLSFEHNKLVRPIVDLRPLGACLKELLLGGNPLDYLPELSHCVSLRRLSLVNARICATGPDDADGVVEVTECRADDSGGASGAAGGTAMSMASADAHGPDAAGLVVSDVTATGSVTAALLSRVAGLTGSFTSTAAATPSAAAGGPATGGSAAGTATQAASPAGATTGAPASGAAASGPDFSAFYALIFRFSSCQLPLLAAAVAQLAQEPAQAEAMAAAEGGVQQLLSMALSDNQLVVSRACATLACLAQSPTTANKLLAARAAARLLALLRSTSPAAQCAALRVTASLAWASTLAAGQLAVLSPLAPGSSAAPPSPTPLLQVVASLCGSYHTDVCVCALLALGNMAALTHEAAACQRTMPGVVALLTQLACDTSPAHRAHHGGDTRVRRAATRALALLGYNDVVSAATGRLKCVAPSRGLRILVMDGGGMRGLATLRMLRQLESRTGRRIHELFDLIGGTSTGGVLAVALGVHGHDLDTCEALYRHLGSQVFSTSASREDTASWQARLGALYGSASSQLRVAVSGCKHDAGVFERLMREACAFADGSSGEDSEPSLIDTAARGGNAVFVVATLMSVTPAVPFIFRNYQPDVSTTANAATTPARPLGWNEAGAIAPSPGARNKPGSLGSCTHKVWHAVRASSAAPYYLADFVHGGMRWQDGAVLANNPAALALEEAALRWPGVPIDVIVSCGSGNMPVKLRDASTISRFVDAGTVLVESACDVHRTDDVLRLLAPAAGIQYFRFNPIDERCTVELDELDEGLLKGLCEATHEYCAREAPKFDACAAALGAGLVPAPSQDGGESENSGGDASIVPPPPPCLVDAARTARAARLAQEAVRSAASHKGDGAGGEASSPGAAVPPPAAASSVIVGANPRVRLNLGSRRCGVAIFDAPRGDISPGSAVSVSDSVATACAQLGLPCQRTDVSRPALTPPEVAAALRTALQGGYEYVHWAGYGTPASLAQLGVPSSEQGLILAWRTDVTAVAEPSETAAAFVASVAGAEEPREPVEPSPGSALSSRHRARSLADVVAAGQPFEAAGILHVPLGATSLASVAGHPPDLADASSSAASPAPVPVFSAVFKRTLPARVLTPDDLRVGTSNTWGPPSSTAAALICARPCPLALAASALDAGACAVLTWTQPATSGHFSDALLAAFFAALYASLLAPPAASHGEEGGTHLAERIAVAAHAAVAQCGPDGWEGAPSSALRVLALRNGCVVALRAAPDATLASGERVAHPGVAGLMGHAATIGGGGGGGGAYQYPPLTPATPRSSLSLGGPSSSGGPLSPTSPGWGEAASGPGFTAGGGTPSRRIW